MEAHADRISLLFFYFKSTNNDTILTMVAKNDEDGNFKIILVLLGLQGCRGP